MTAVAGIRGTGDWGADERPKNFRETILFLNPNGKSPLFALMGKAKTKSTNDPEFKWWNEQNDLMRFQVNGQVTNVGVTVSIDSIDPTADTFGDVPWGHITHLKPGDLLMVEPTTETEAYADEILEVVTVDASNSRIIVGTRSNTQASSSATGTLSDTIANDAYLLKIGSAYAEGTNSPDATTRNPVQWSNFCQIFKNAYELTETARETYARTGSAESNDKKRKVFDHSRDIELAIMFGRKHETVGSNGKPKRFMGGLREYIPAATTTVLGAGVTLTNFLDAVQPIFDWDSPAGDERLVFCGNQFLTRMNELALSNGDVTFGAKITMFGMNLREFILPQGTLFLRSHPLMNRHPTYKKSAFVIDPTSLTWRPLRETRPQDNIQANDADTKKGQWLTEGGLMVDYGGRTNGYLANFVSVA